MSAETYLVKALGPLSALLDDPSVIEIAVNPDGTVWIERSGDALMRAADIRLAANDARLLATQLAGPKSLGANTPLVTSSRPRGQDVWRVQILLGEIRGIEAWSYLEAINTGHDGSISTIHGNSPAAALERLAFLVMRAGLGLLRTEIVDYARSIIDCVVQLERKDGRRCISHIEICDSGRWRLTA